MIPFQDFYSELFYEKKVPAARCYKIDVIYFSRINELQKEITKSTTTSKETDSYKESLKAEVTKLKSIQSELEKKIILKDEKYNDLEKRISKANITSKETESYQGKLRAEAAQLKAKLKVHFSDNIHECSK